MFPFQFLEIVDGLTHLDPIGTYTQRAAPLVARLAQCSCYRLEVTLPAASRGVHESNPPPDPTSAPVSIPLRTGKQTVGTIHIHPPEGVSKLGPNELRLARWGARLLARGIVYVHRLADSRGRATLGDVDAALAKSPLTPRERDVVALLMSGASTREIASRTGLTVATVHTYLKRIYPKLGVHSRVELVARMAGTRKKERTT